MTVTNDYAPHKHFYSDEIPDLVARCASARPWQTLLDAGCGDGCLLYGLGKQDLLQDKDVFAIDLSPTRVERIRQLGLGVQCFVGDVCDMRDIGDGTIDLLVTTQVIEHVLDDEKMVREMSRVLSPGGSFYLNTVFKKWYGWYYHRCNGKWVIDPSHLREYTHDSQLLDLFSRYGLEVTESRKVPARFSILDFILHRTGASGWAYENRVLALLRRIKIPIFGYYNWEMTGIRR